MRKITAVIEGIAPILFNRFTEEAIDAMEKMSGGKKKTKKDKVVEATTKVYRDAEGFLCVPSDNVKKCILEGCAMGGYKIGRRSAMPFMRATLFLEGQTVSFGKKDPDGHHTTEVFRHDGKTFYHIKEPDGIHECTGRIPPRTGARVVIRRPYLDTGWTLTLPLIAMDDRINDEMIQGSIQEGGLLVGLCDHRPEYGRFKINKFEIKEAKVKKAA